MSEIKGSSPISATSVIVAGQWFGTRASTLVQAPVWFEAKSKRAACVRA